MSFHVRSEEAQVAPSEGLNELLDMSLQELLEVIVTVGTRGAGRTTLDTLAPVDLISTEELRVTGQAELGKALQEIAPSFNFNNTTISDGSDIIRPATLRGLGPDQTLVLINGKRRHQQALVHVQETVGKGSAGYDINAIPLSSIDRIEILRDGAAAQYGSDAIAGVINIILKKQTEKTLVQAERGQTYAGDGANATISLNSGIGNEHLWLNMTLEQRDRGEVNRAGVADLTSTQGVFIGNWLTPDGNPVQRLRIGEAQSDNRYLWVNSGGQLTPRLSFYILGGISDREGKSYGFFRGPDSERTIPALYPEGFLPELLTRVEDESITAGLQGDINGNWVFDTSLSWGQSEFNFFSNNSANVSWYYEPNGQGSIIAQTPTSANDGALKYLQGAANVDLSGDLVVQWLPEPLFVAVGVELRKDAYRITRGDPWSYLYGRSDNPRLNITNIDNGGSAPPGIQGFPGFTPETEVDESRHSKAVYADLETSLSDSTMMAAAVRWEDYEFAGDNVTGKLSFRQEFATDFALRATLSTGFRAPGVQQIYYAQVQTTLVDGDLRETGTFNNTSDVAAHFGIPALQEETSRQASIGFVMQHIDDFFLTVDIYQIDIDDRIVLSDPIVGFSDEVERILDANQLGAAQFFTNAIDTRTRGLDVVGTYRSELGGGTLKLQAAVGLVETQVRALNSSSAIVPSSRLFNAAQIERIEKGQPRERATLSASLVKDNWKSSVVMHYFGDVSGSAFTGISQTWSGRWLTDISFDYVVSDKVTISMGANNLFNITPSHWGEAGKPLSEAGFTFGWETLPFGISGGYYYLRLKSSF
ncbi:TonB-dependent receptor plug domain-containing protein [Alteromonas sediminis]|nr:TonB-dependent receptor [Alteromonas sediminis]